MKPAEVCFYCHKPIVADRICQAPAAGGRKCEPGASKIAHDLVRRSLGSRIYRGKR